MNDLREWGELFGSLLLLLAAFAAVPLAFVACGLIH